ncbi:MAG: hypothetical protein C4567_07625 [Deltaproteobacteria bacterium]|nr:MAG: hypothetical protein C4567_07625 [Deltaproteobacteria bacterium]
MRLSNRVTRLEGLKAPGPPLEAMLIHRRPGEPKEQAAERYFTEYPERRGDTKTPRVFLTLNPFPEVST